VAAIYNLVFHLEACKEWDKLSEWQKRRLKLSSKKLYIGHEKREGWLGELPFYIFWCHECDHCAKDYPHGDITHQYLVCSFCGVSHRFVPLKVFWLTLFETIKINFQLRFSRK